MKSTVLHEIHHGTKGSLVVGRWLGGGGRQAAEPYFLYTLLLLIFAGLNFRDFRDCKNIAKLKTREKKLSRKLMTRNLIACYKTLLLTLTSVYMIT